MMKQACTLFAAFFLFAAPALGQGWNVDLVGTAYGYWGGTNSIAAQGNYTYMGVYEGDISVVDVSDPADPIEVARWYANTPYSHYCRAVMGDYLYVGTALSGWCLLDVSNPLDPELAAQFPAPSAEEFCFAGNSLFIVDDNHLYIYDNANPLTPVELSRFQLTGYGGGIVVSGGYAYVTNAFSGGVQVIDVSDPFHPAGLAFLDLPGQTDDIVKSGDYAYTCGSFGSSVIIDVSDPAHPGMVAGFYAGDAISLEISGNIVYVIHNQEGILVVDISHPTIPEILSQYPGALDPVLLAMDLDGTHLYGAYGYAGIKIIDASNPQNLQLISSYEPDWTLRDVAYQNGYAFLAADDDGLLIQDVSNPENPFQIGYLDDIDDCFDVILMGDYAYLQTYSDTTKVVDISDPAHPHLAESLDLQGVIRKIQDGLAYTGGYEIIRILDMANPLNPVQIGAYNRPLAGFWNLDTDGRFLYAIATFDGYDWAGVDSLMVLDINDPANPQPLGMYPLGDYYSSYGHVMALGDGYVYVVSNDPSFRIFDTSDPTHLVLVYNGTIALAPSEIVAVGNFVYVSNEWSQVSGPRIFDVSDPTNPVLVGYYGAPAVSYQHIAVHDDYIYATESMRFRVYNCSDAIHNDVNVTLTPLIQPIQIPASGGGFDYYIFAQNNGPGNQTLDLWTKAILPSGSVLSPILGPVSVSLDSGTTGWIRHQSVPGSAPAGQYTYIACAGDYPNSVWASDSLQFTKLGSGTQDSGFGDWSNTGEEFGESEKPLITHHSSLITSIRPNPFNPSTALSYQLEASNHVSLKVHDIAGRLVATLVDGRRQAGAHEVTFDGSELPSGIYLYRLQAGDFTASGKMLLLK